MDADSLRAALPRTWDALLAHHGRPTAIQLAAAGPLLQGQDALLMAPTAAGKTVAYLAPLVEKWVPADAKVPRLLVVSPTRALVNDLARRIKPRLHRLGISVGRWTGDHHDGGTPQPVTVLTPEALDARLARSPGVLREVQALVLDELHVLDGTVRGDQLRILVQRMRLERRTPEGPRPIQVVGASATVVDPAGLSARYLREGVLVEAGERRAVRARVVRGRDLPAVHAHLHQAVQDGFRKVLLFVDRRDEVEDIAAFLSGRPPFGSAVLAHHGSLSRQARLSAEERFQTSPASVCVATSTLELGIDIGDIDLVGLVGLPPDLSALSQRVGRGRRRGGAHAAICFASDAFEEAAFRAWLGARRGPGWPDPPPPFLPGVLIQQAVVIASSRGSRTVDAGALCRRLPPDLAAEWSPSRVEAILAQAAHHAWLAPTGVSGPGGQVWRVGERGEQAWHRGQSHANLGDRPQVRIVDGMTGDTIGHLDRVDGAHGLGGRQRVPLLQDEERVVVRAGGPGGRTRFGSGGGPRRGAAPCRAMLKALGLPLRARVVLPSGAVALLHGLGDSGSRLLGWVLRDAKVVGKGGLAHTGPYGLVLKGGPNWDRWPGPSAVPRALALHGEALGARLSTGAFHRFLPEEERVALEGVLCNKDLVAAWLVGGPPEWWQGGTELGERGVELAGGAAWA